MQAYALYRLDRLQEALQKLQQHAADTPANSLLEAQLQHRMNNYAAAIEIYNQLVQQRKVSTLPLVQAHVQHMLSQSHLLHCCATLCKAMQQALQQVSVNYCLLRQQCMGCDPRLELAGKEQTASITIRMHISCQLLTHG